MTPRFRLLFPSLVAVLVLLVGATTVPSQTVSVGYRTQDATAEAGSDYVADSGKVTFAPGETSQTVTIQVMGDTVDEPDERFYLILENSTNATIADGEGEGTIIDDDDPTATLAIDDVSLPEGDSGSTDAVLTVTLTGPTGQDVSVDYTTANGTAVAGEDYGAHAGSLDFPVGTTSRTIAVAVSGDTNVEGDETFLVNLSGAVGALISDSQGQVTITNDDIPPPVGEAVVWTNAAGVSVAGNSVTKTAATAWGNAGASSIRALDGDGFVQFTLPADPGYAMFGLASGDAGQDYADIDFAFYTYPDTGQLMIFEGGAYRGGVGTYAAGDTLRVSVEAGAILYSHNGSTAFTSAQAPALPLCVDTSLYSSGASVQDAQLAGAVVDVPAPATEAVVWVNTVGVSVSGNSISKTASTAWGNAGASSTRALDGDGFVEFTLPADPGYAMFGLAHGDSSQEYADIDFAFYTYPGTGQLMIFENDGYRGGFGTYAAGDTLRVSQEAGSVLFYRNGALLYTSSQAPTLPLRVDTSLYSNGAAVENAVLGGVVVDLGAPATEPVAWTNLVGVSVAGNSITKIASTAWGNAGASSTRALDGEGYAEFTLPADPGYAMFGLAHGDSDQAYADIDFAFYTYAATGQLMIFEGNTYVGIFGTYATGDTLRVSLEAGVVNYYLNDTVIHTSTQAATLPLRVDTSLYSNGASVQNALLAGTLVDVVPAPEAVAWTNAVGVSVAGSSLTKTEATGWGNAGASSTRALGGGEGYAEFTVGTDPGYAMFGLASGDPDLEYVSIDFAFYTYADTGQLMIFESGTYRGSFGAYTAGDTLRVSVDASGTVRYYRNGSLVYTSSQIATLPLRVDTSLYSNGATVEGAVIAGGS